MHNIRLKSLWLLQYLISQHPQVEGRICEELHGLGLLAQSGSAAPRAVEYEDLGKIPYLSACIKVRLFIFVGICFGVHTGVRRDFRMQAYGAAG